MIALNRPDCRQRRPPDAPYGHARAWSAARWCPPAAPSLPSLAYARPGRRPFLPWLRRLPGLFVQSRLGDVAGFVLDLALDLSRQVRQRRHGLGPSDERQLYIPP